MRLVPRFTLLMIALAGMAAAQRLEVTSRLGTRFYSQPDPKKTVGHARRELSRDPTSPELLQALAQAQVAVWEEKEAVETLTRAIESSPKNADFWTERGHRELPLREFAKARADLEHAVELNPQNMTAYYHLGLAHYFLGEFSEAADAFAHAVATAPNTDEKINSTNWLYAALRRAGKTVEAAKALEAIPPDMTNQAAHTKFYLDLVRFFQGKTTADQAMPPTPPAGNVDQEVELPFDTVGYGIGNWYLYNGDPAKAQTYFHKVLQGQVWITWGFIGSELEAK